MIGGWERVLVLSPHTDDAELGCGGTIARLAMNGCKVLVMAFTVPEPALELAREAQEATRALGLPSWSLVLPAEDESTPVTRRVSESRQDVLDLMIQERERYEPDAVLMPSRCDVHQDHQAIHAEGLRAFKGLTLLGYQLPWNHYRFEAQALVRLEPHHLDRKLAAVACYQSQAHRPYTDPDYVKAVARTAGIAAGAPLAEAFEVYRLVT